MIAQECKEVSRMFELLQELHDDFPQYVPQVEEIFTRTTRDFLSRAVCCNKFLAEIPLSKN